MTEERRKDDKRWEALNARLTAIEESIRVLDGKVSVVQQRQTEMTIPFITEMHTIMHGNGKPGILREHEVCKEKMRSLESTRTWAQGSMLVVLLAIIAGIWQTGQIYGQIGHLLK